MLRHTIFLAAALLTGPLAASTAHAAGDGYRIFISADMEGLSGAVSTKQYGATGAEYQNYRKELTAEVLAAVQGAREAGATEFVVADSHGDLQNIIVEDLPDDVTLVRGGPRRLSMMEGIQARQFDGVFFIGYHSGASSLSGVAAHTWVSRRVSEVRLNDVPASEGYINAALAGEFGIPVLLVTGDDAAVSELKRHVPGVEGAIVKRSVGFHAAEVMSPGRAQMLIREAAKRAVSAIGQSRPFKIASPVQMDIRFHFYRPAETLAFLPIVERPDARTIRYKSGTMAEAVRFLEFAFEYSPELEP